MFDPTALYHLSAHAITYMIMKLWTFQALQSTQISHNLFVVLEDLNKLHFSDIQVLGEINNQIRRKQILIGLGIKYTGRVGFSEPKQFKSQANKGAAFHELLIQHSVFGQ